MRYEVAPILATATAPPTDPSSSANDAFLTTRHSLCQYFLLVAQVGDNRTSSHPDL